MIFIVCLFCFLEIFDLRAAIYAKIATKLLNSEKKNSNEMIDKCVSFNQTADSVEISCQK